MWFIWLSRPSAPDPDISDHMLQSTSQYKLTQSVQIGTGFTRQNFPTTCSFPLTCLASDWMRDPNSKLLKGRREKKRGGGGLETNTLLKCSVKAQELWPWFICEKRNTNKEGKFPTGRWVVRGTLLIVSLATWNASWQQCHLSFGDGSGWYKWGQKKKAGRGRNNEDKSSFKICTQFLKPSELWYGCSFKEQKTWKQSLYTFS